jgi:hypothetical protein
MSVQAITWVLRGGPDGGGVVIDVKPGDRVRNVMFVLADYANRDHLAWPSLTTIMGCARVSERTARRALRLLERSGLIMTVTPGGGRNRSAVYRVDVRNPASPGPVSSSETRPSQRETRPGPRLNPATGGPRSHEPKEPRVPGWRQVDLGDGRTGWVASPQEQERP